MHSAYYFMKTQLIALNGYILEIKTKEMSQSCSELQSKRKMGHTHKIHVKNPMI
jgi:hypothetical protein